MPLRGKQGTGWDIANAALYLASDEAECITGAALPVDGGALLPDVPPAAQVAAALCTFGLDELRPNASAPGLVAHG